MTKLRPRTNLTSQNNHLRIRNKSPKNAIIVAILYSIILTIAITSHTQRTLAFSNSARVPIVFGQVTAGSITIEGQTVSYTFDGISGDRIRAKAVRTAGNLNIDIDIYRPNGTTICSTIFTDTTCELDTTGTHTLIISGSGTGNFNLFLQRLNSPIGCTPLIVDASPSSASINQESEMNCHTFSGSTGDRMRIRALRTSGDLNIDIDVYRPDGTQVCSTIFTDYTCELDISGTHMILIFGSGTGEYDLYIQRLNNPVGCTSLTIGASPSSASINQAPEMNCHTFNGSTGDHMRIRALRTSGDLNIDINVYRPDGTQVCSTIFTDYTCELDTSGTHMILIFGSGTGEYDLYIQRLNNPVGCTSLTIGASPSSASINQAPEMNCHTFNGSTGDRMRIRALRTSGDLNIDIDVYRPDGTQVCSTIFTDYTCELDTSGTHFILIFGSGTGDYNLYLQRLNDPVGCTPLTIGAPPITASITQAAEVDCYTFTGATADPIRIRAVNTSGNLNIDMDVYRPDGTLVCSTIFTDYTCHLDTDGTHTILIFGSGSGDYNISLLCLSVQCGVVSPLLITQSDSPDPAVVGNPLTYLLKVTNVSTTTVTNITMTDTLPANVTYQSTVTTQGSCTLNGNLLRCELGSLNVGEEAAVTVIVIPTEIGTITNSVQTTATSNPPTDDTNVEMTTVIAPNTSACPGATIHSVGDGAWNEAATWNLNRIPRSGDVISVEDGHTVTAPPFAQMAALCNYGFIHSTAVDNISLSASGFISNYGEIQGMSGTIDIDNTCGAAGRSVELRGSPLYNGGTIQAGDGGDGEQCGGNGGSTMVLGQDTVNHGKICAGKGGSILGTAAGTAGHGGHAHIWGKYQQYGGHLINTGLTCAGDGGESNPNAVGVQRGGDGGTLKLISLPYVFLNNGRHYAGFGGRGAGGGSGGHSGTVIIEPNTISLSGSQTEIRGGNIIIFGGSDWTMDLQNLSSTAISAHHSITLAVGSGGTIDLTNNGQQVLHAGGQVTIASDEILFDNEVEISDLAGSNVQTTGSQLLQDASWFTPQQVSGQPGNTVALNLTLLNNGPISDTYTLQLTNSAGWNTTALPNTITIDGIDHQELVLDVTLPSTASAGASTLIILSATSQLDPNLITTAEIEVIVAPSTPTIYLPLLFR